MTGIKTITAAVLVFASISTAAHSAQVIGQKLATKDWFDYKLTWFSGSPSYVAKWHVMDQGGAVVICGVGAYIDNSMRSNTDGVLRDLGFYIDKTLYLVDMKFFSRVNRPNDLIGAKANCASTGKAPPRKVENGVSLRPTHPKKRY